MFIVILLYGGETELPGPRWLTMLSTNESQEAVHLQKQCLPSSTESSIMIMAYSVKIKIHIFLTEFDIVSVKIVFLVINPDCKKNPLCFRNIPGGGGNQYNNTTIYIRRENE